MWRVIFLRMTNRFGVLLHPDDVRWAATEGVSETVIAAVLLLHERSVQQIVAELTAVELEQVIKLVGRSPRVYPPGTLDALKHWGALVSPEPPQQSGEGTRSEVAAEKRHAGMRGADPRGQPSRGQPCAGNCRTKFDPPTAGEKWDLGAVSTGEWTGVPLMEVLDRAGIEPAAREVLFRGADHGIVEDSSSTIRYERSLRLEEAAVSGAILAYVMNGEPLPIHHGFPLRLIVPSWYAVASVKWLTDIELIGHHLRRSLSNRKILVRVAARRRGRARTRHTNAGTGAHHRTKPRLRDQARRYYDSRSCLVRLGSN
jgi:hypothetical protein